MEALVLAAAVTLAVVGLGALALSLRRPPAAPALEGVLRSLGQLQAGVERLASGHESLRSEVQRGREASLRELFDATQGLRSELSSAQRTLGEVRALDGARAQQLAAAASSLRRLEAVVAGSATRGAAGENVLAAALGQLPPDLLETNAAFGGKLVEYALRLPGGRLLPIDSKWPSALPLERLAADPPPDERRRLVEQVVREVRGRAREMGKYLDPERTLGLGLLAVPDAVHALSAEAQIEAARDGVVIVPYSLALPYVLSLMRLAARFAAAAEIESALLRLHDLDEALRRMDDEIEGRLSRALVQAGNARDALRDELGGARRSLTGLLREAGAGPAAQASPPAELTRSAQSR